MSLLESKKSNPWISHVKEYQIANACSYAEALKLSKDSYKKASPKKAEDMCTETVDIESFKDTKKPLKIVKVKSKPVDIPEKSKPIDIPEKPKRVRKVKAPVESVVAELPQ